MAKKVKGITDLGSGVYLLDYQVKKVRKQVRFHADTLKQAKDKREELIFELRQELKSPRVDEDRLKVEFPKAFENIEANLKSEGRSQKNILRHRRLKSRLMDFSALKFQNVKGFNQITSPYMEEYKSFFVNDQDHCPNGGLKAELVCFKSAVRRAHRLGHCTKEVVELLSGLKIPRPKKKEYPDIPNSDLKRLDDYVQKDKPEYYRPFKYILRTGRRIGETLMLERRDVKWLGLKPVSLNVRAETTKMKNSAPIGLDDELSQIVADAYQYGSKHKTIYLFCNDMGKKISHTNFLNYLSKASMAVLGIKLTPHYFRHHFFTELGKHGLLTPDAFSIANVKSLNVVQDYYQHRTVAGQDKVLELTRI